MLDKELMCKCPVTNSVSNCVRGSIALQDLSEPLKANLPLSFPILTSLSEFTGR